MMRRSRVACAYAVGDKVAGGFVCRDVRDVKELNLTGYQFVHERTGATAFHFDIPDRNNAFCIGFRTPAPSHAGTTHVLEHTVLCGSKKYPVRDPFFLMIRRTLSNFMNAMTGADYTIYPFATTNAKDYSNLLDVYLDATLQPLLRSEDFRQEGHRLEHDSATGAITHNGVVFNEMKGVLSDPSRHFSQRLQALILPDTHYAFVSGGRPEQILDLTHEELIAYHRKHYHPSNAVIMTYGDQPFAETFERLNAAFEPFERLPEEVVVPMQTARFSEKITAAETGPLDTFGNPTEQKRVICAASVPSHLDTSDGLVKLMLLNDLLTSGPSSPMYKSLIESRIGTKFAPGSGYHYHLSSPVLAFGLEGIADARAGADDEVETIVDRTINEVMASGFDERRVESSVFQEILSQKHRDANYGIGLVTSLSAIALVKPHQNVLHFLNTVPTLEAIAKDHKAELLPLLDEAFRANPHKLRLSMTPDKEFISKMNAPIEKKAAAITEKMTPEEKSTLTKQNEEWLSRVRAHQDTSVLPSLRVTDIPRQAPHEPEPREVAARTYHIPHPTNGLVYVHGFLPLLATEAQRLQQLAQGVEEGRRAVLDDGLLHSLIGRTGAGAMDFKELSIASELCMTGFSLSPLLDNCFDSVSDFAAGSLFSFYTIKEKLPAALALVEQILCAPKTSSAEISERVDILATSRASSIARSVTHRGNAMAVLKAASPASPVMMLKELRGGLTQVKDASAVLSLSNDEKAAHVASTVEKYAAFCSDVRVRAASAKFWFTCEEGDAPEVTRAFAKLRSALHQADPRVASDVIAFAKGPAAAAGTHERVPLMIDTSFAAAVIPHDFSYASVPMQRVRVASAVLKNELLHRVVREEGGAYGASCSGNLLGTAHGISMSSYRDPAPDNSLKAFAACKDWLEASGNVTSERIEQAKLTLFSSIDAPRGPESFGYDRLITRTTPELEQSSREALLGVTTADVIAQSGSFAFAAANTVCLVPDGKATEVDTEVDTE